MAKKTVDLVSKDGKRSWSTDSPVEITNLRAQGWSEKPATKPDAADKPAASKTNK